MSGTGDAHTAHGQPPEEQAPDEQASGGVPGLTRFRQLPLRSRLALLIAVAVAFAVALSAAACWLITRDRLTEQLDTTLSTVDVPGDYVQALGARCAGTPLNVRFQPTPYTIQLVTPSGYVCTSPNKQPIPAQRADEAVADGRLASAVHTTKDENGTPMRVSTVPYRGPLTDIQGNRLAVSVAAPMDQVTDPLNQLALVLLVVAGVGVLGAATAGLWVARAALKPVDRLTAAVEHVARTQDLAIRIPTDGEDEIARLSRSFNAMTAALAASRDLQQQLIADAGHELRTPLTSLRTNIDLLERSERSGRPIPAADKEALLASVKAQMGELAALIGDLQVLSRPPETGTAGGTAAVRVVALHDIVGTALERARLRGPSLTLTADLAPWYVRAEPAALERAVVNLLDNAVKFSPSGGTIEVRLAGGALTVRDDGPGIPPEELPHVFERFWRSPSARSLPGSGLGLSIVARTAEQAGGGVRLRNAPGGGTEALLTLPGAPTPPPDIPERTGTPDAAGAANAAGAAGATGAASATGASGPAGEPRERTEPCERTEPGRTDSGRTDSGEGGTPPGIPPGA
ncbi:MULTISPECIES: HAMP domain-containing sensor histidine kinase [unclassified Streptomyces]|uniref:sensor histidine kinase n=1 Tax=unclassified Streptomyces TaxID=2593676 RepID=UPI000367D349|nr:MULTISPECIES: HAMP domain-containing sensor histidine kinase [unclassified Streptomyces]MYT32744.1 HAMP domain-containing protein [Streptomyces sp. SID8354]